MKKLAVTLVGASLAVAVMQANAEDAGMGFDVSMNVGIVSDYLFRGISQTGTRGAIQGGMDIKHSSGAYVGTWMSSLNTAFADVEQDLYGGYGYSVTPDIALDVHVIEYTYPGGSGADLMETHGGATFSNLAATGDSLTVGADYSGDAPLTTNTGKNATWNYSLGYSYPLPMDMTLSATAGYMTFKKDLVFGNRSQYSYWNLGVAKKLVGVNWALSYNDTNLSKTECSAFTGNTDSCKAEVVLAATKSF